MAGRTPRHYAPDPAVPRRSHGSESDPGTGARRLTNAGGDDRPRRGGDAGAVARRGTVCVAARAVVRNRQDRAAASAAVLERARLSAHQRQPARQGRACDRLTTARAERLPAIRARCACTNDDAPRWRHCHCPDARQGTDRHTLAARRTVAAPACAARDSINIHRKRARRLRDLLVRTRRTGIRMEREVSLAGDTTLARAGITRRHARKRSATDRPELGARTRCTRDPASRRRKPPFHRGCGTGIRFVLDRTRRGGTHLELALRIARETPVGALQRDHGPRRRATATAGRLAALGRCLGHPAHGQHRQRVRAHAAA